MLKIASFLRPKERLYVAGIVGTGQNNFDFFRLIAALAVLYYHAFPLFGDQRKEPVFILLKFADVGKLALVFFFFLSGLLITGSFLASSSPLSFVYKRVARLWPCLIVCLLLTVFVVGPLFTSLSLSGYFQSPVTWHYLAANIIQYRYSYILPGVFEHNHYSDVVNGSLWTLGIEIRAYLFIFIAGMLLLFRRKAIFFLLTVLLVAIFFLKSDPLVRIFQSWDGVCYFYWFLAGANVFLFREKIPLHWAIALLLAGCFAYCHFYWERLAPLSFCGAFLYTTLLGAQHPMLMKVKLKGDYSYGVYIYGFLIQQCLAACFPACSVLLSLLITFPVTILVAVFSWHLVEYPALKLARRR